MRKQQARLENWEMVDRIMYGTVYGHPRLPDGMPIHTSTVLSVNFETKVCRTLNTIYQLGSPAPASS